MFEIQEGQTVSDLVLSPDDEHVFLLVTRAAHGRAERRHAELRDRVGYTEMIPGRTNVGDAQDRRRLAVLNLKTGKTVWADSVVRRARSRWCSPRRRAATSGTRTARSRGACRFSRPTASLPSPGRAPRTSRTAGSSSSTRRAASAGSIDTLHDDAWVRDGAGFGRSANAGLPARRPPRLLHLGEGRLDAPVRRWTPRSRRAGEGPDDGTVRGRHGARCRPTARRSTSPRASATRASATSTRCRSTAARGRS